MMIGTGKERGSLYYLEGVEQSQIQSGCGFQVAGKILLWHRRLRHPSFIYLEHLFPNLFAKVSVSSL